MNNIQANKKSLLIYKDCLEVLLGGQMNLKMKIITSFNAIQCYTFFISLLLLLTIALLFIVDYEIFLKLFILCFFMVAGLSLYILSFQKKQLRYTHTIRTLLKHPTPLLIRLLDKVNKMI